MQPIPRRLRLFATHVGLVIAYAGLTLLGTTLYEFAGIELEVAQLLAFCSPFLK